MGMGASVFRVNGRAGCSSGQGWTQPTQMWPESCWTGSVHKHSIALLWWCIKEIRSPYKCMCMYSLNRFLFIYQKDIGHSSDIMGNGLQSILLLFKSLYSIAGCELCHVIIWCQLGIWNKKCWPSLNSDLTSPVNLEIRFLKQVPEGSDCTHGAKQVS